MKNKLTITVSLCLFVGNAAAVPNHPSASISPTTAAAANGTPPTMRGSETASRENAQRPKVTSPSETCTAHQTDYSEYYAPMFDKGPSVMSQCGLGKLVDFDLLKLFDPTGALLDAMQGALCGWANDAFTPFQNAWNRKVGQANQWVSDRNRGYSDWVDSRAQAVYYQLYAAYQSDKEAGLSDIGYPYDTLFSDPAAVPVGSTTQGTGGSSGGDEGGSTSGQTGGAFNSGSYDGGDIYVIDQGSGPVVIETQESQSRTVTPQSYQTKKADAEINPNEDLESLFRIFQK